MDGNRALRVVSMEELKKQMRVDLEDEDETIMLYGIAAEDVVVYGTARTMDELNRIGYFEKTGEHPNANKELPEGNWFPDRLRLAVLVLAAHYYRNREAVASVAQNAVPYIVEVLIKPYRKLTEREV